MKSFLKLLPKLPGWIASVLMICVISFWTFWSFGEMYHEGWWGKWTNRLPYLAPAALTLIPTLLAFRWPIPGGVIITLVGVFALFFFSSDVSMIGLAIALIGVAFVTDGLVKRRFAAAPVQTQPLPWWRRRWRYVLALGIPLVIAIGISASMLPVVLTRVDDGNRGARLIEGNGLALIWAPAGPGWNWKQPWGGYPSWQSIALYGVEPVGLGEKPGYEQQSAENAARVFATEEDMARTNLCRYLNADGTALLDEPQDVWHMPTTDEIVRSLGRHGENAGCVWQGELGTRVSCVVQPDKESPLWATDQPVIYYWTADSYNETRGNFVAFNGTVNASYKTGGNPRHSYRCVRTP